MGLVEVSFVEAEPFKFGQSLFLLLGGMLTTEPSLFVIRRHKRTVRGWTPRTNKLVKPAARTSVYIDDHVQFHVID